MMYLFYILGNAIWSLMLSLIFSTATTSPSAFSSSAWSFVTDSVYPWMGAAGATLLNIFMMVGLLRETTNIREGLTLERFVETCIKGIIANWILLNGFSLMKTLFSLSVGMTKNAFAGTSVSWTGADVSTAAQVLFGMSFGLVYLIVSMVCAGTILLVIYGRYLQIYLLAATFPVAFATLPGGPGVSRTAAAWFRDFLAKVFSIVIIALSLNIASRMLLSEEFFSSVVGDLGVFEDLTEGVVDMVVSMFNMVILSAAVKGADSFMKRAFAL